MIGIGVVVHWLSLGFSHAQEPSLRAEVRRINHFQQEVDSVFDRCEEIPEDCPAYVDKISVNDYNGSWPAVGIFKSEQSFWYRRTSEGEGSKELELLKVVVHTQRSNRTELEEYYFSYGQLISYHFRLENGEESQDFRFYFQFGKLVDYIESITPNERDYRALEEGAASQVRHWGGLMIQKFELNHE